MAESITGGAQIVIPVRESLKRMSTKDLEDRLADLLDADPDELEGGESLAIDNEIAEIEAELGRRS
jgi:hypothetical protein